MSGDDELALGHAQCHARAKLYRIRAGQITNLCVSRCRQVSIALALHASMVLAGVVGSTISGCHGTETRQPTQRPSKLATAPTTDSSPAAKSPNVEHEYRGFPVAMPPLVSLELRPLYHQWANQNDQRSWYLAQEQKPPVGFHPLRKGLVRRFPGRSLTVVRAYIIANDSVYPDGSDIDTTVPGCGGRAVASDGTFCPTTLYPGEALSPEQGRDLVAIVNAPNDLPLVVPNGYNFRYSFVFFDDQDVPLAEVDVDLGVVKLVTTPSLKHAGVDTMSPQRRDRMRALLTDVGLYHRDAESTLGQALNEQQELDGRALHSLRWVPAMTGVDPQTVLANSSPREKALLCAWQAQVWRSGLPRHNGGKITCDDDTTVAALSFADCQALVPSCNASVGQIEDCMRRQRVDPCLTTEAARPCRMLSHCFWGMSFVAR